MWLTQGQGIYAQDLNQGLISSYPFDGNANDLAGNNHGTVHGAILTKDRFGLENKAYAFDGITSYIRIPSNQFLNFEYDENFSIAVWVKIASSQQDLDGHNNEILGKWNTTLTQSYPYAIRFWNEKATGERREKVFGLRYDTQACGHNPYITASCALSRDEWHHIVFIKDGNKLQLFQDGLFVGETIDNTSQACNTSNINPIYVGKRDTNRRYFTGAIDDIRFYDRPLSDDEVEQLFHLGGWSRENLNYAELDFNQFSVPGSLSESLDEENNVIIIEMPCQTDLTELVPEFIVDDNIRVQVNGVNQVSGTTINDFSSSKIYLLSDNRYCNDAEWTVRVILDDTQEISNKLAQFTSITIENQVGLPDINSDSKQIKFMVECHAEPDNLSLNFETDPTVETIWEADILLSGATLDFSNPLNVNLRNNDICLDAIWEISVEVKKQTIHDLLSRDDFYIPNVITPNKDGINEAFTLGEFLPGSDVSIYNRYGLLVYKDLNYENDFTGASLTPGKYYYTIKSRCLEESIKGPLTILY